MLKESEKIKQPMFTVLIVVFVACTLLMFPGCRDQEQLAENSTEATSENIEDRSESNPVDAMVEKPVSKEVEGAYREYLAAKMDQVEKCIEELEAETENLGEEATEEINESINELADLNKKIQKGLEEVDIIDEIEKDFKEAKSEMRDA